MRPGQPQNLFEYVERVIIQGPPITEGKADSKQTISLDDDLKKWLEDVSNAISEATNNPKYGASTLGREGLAFFRMFFPVHKKMIKHEKAIVALLENLS